MLVVWPWRRCVHLCGWRDSRPTAPFPCSPSSRPAVSSAPRRTPGDRDPTGFGDHQLAPTPAGEFPSQRQSRCADTCGTALHSGVMDRAHPPRVRVPGALRRGVARTSLSPSAFCVGTVSDTLQTPVKHCDLRGHSDAHRCCGKSLVGTALPRFDVHQHAQPARFPSVPDRPLQHLSV
jgi:hypothetical protein